MMALLLWLASLFGLHVEPHNEGVVVEYTKLSTSGIQCFRHVWISALGEPAMGEICSPSGRVP